jgi:hypothetical protein
MLVSQPIFWYSSWTNVHFGWRVFVDSKLERADASLRRNKSTSHARRVRRGFTLIDVFVSVGVIAILIGILLPSLGRARETARRVVCSVSRCLLTITVATCPRAASIRMRPTSNQHSTR